MLKSRAFQPSRTRHTHGWVIDLQFVENHKSIKDKTRNHLFPAPLPVASLKNDQSLKVMGSQLEDGLPLGTRDGGVVGRGISMNRTNVRDVLVE